jgi:hypothetical protein
MSAKRTTGPGEFDSRKVDRAVARAGAAISKAIDKMVADLPEGADLVPRRRTDSIAAGAHATGHWRPRGPRSLRGSDSRDPCNASRTDF